MANNKKNPRYSLDFLDETFETLQEKAKRPTKTAAQVLNDLVGEVTTEGKDLTQEVIRQINIFAGDLSPNQELDLSKAHGDKKHDEKETKSQHKEAGIDYKGEILHGSEKISKSENYHLEHKIQQILFELK